MKGKIQSGMLADFVVLGEDPFAAPGQRLREIPVLAVYMDGKCVCRKE